MNNKEKFALLAITFCLLLAGWMDGQDAKTAERYSASIAGQKLACLSCAGGVR
jgi:hypothetical protein